MTVTIGSGIGGWAAVVAQPTYGATIIPPTRPLSTLKKATATWDPHFVQGTDYLVGGRTIDIGSAHITTYLDAKGTISGDMPNVGAALLVASAFGASSALTQFGTTTAYKLGGASGVSYNTPDGNAAGGGTTGAWFDMQWAVPTTDGTLQAYTFHSCMITKATWTFERSGLVTYEYEFDAQYVDINNTNLIATPSFPSGLVPFAMQGTTPFCKVGTFGSEVAVDGLRKVTVTLERQMSTDRIYLGFQYKDQPVTKGYSKLTAVIDADFTPAAKTALYAQFLNNAAFSVIVESVGNLIGSSGISDTFSLNPTNCFVQTGGEPNLESPDMIKSSLNLMGTINASNTNALIGQLWTGDSSF